MKNIFKISILLLVALNISSCSDDDDICTIDRAIEGASSEIAEVSETYHTVYTDIVINASAQEVWAVLTDFDNMSTWSTGFLGMTGDISDGGQVVTVFVFPDAMTGVPTAGDYPHTLIYNEGIEFGWSDPILGLDGIVDNHFYTVEAISDCQTRFIQTDEFQGVNPNITTEILASNVVDSYNQFNEELKTEIEN
jgi:hypothetical protein